ncbi:STKc_PknB_like domain containing protein [Candidatus Nanopelagicaceae bacterium]
MKQPIQPLRDGDPKSFQGWAIKGLIGEGGQSTIFLAEKNGQRAALKMIRKEYLANQKSVDRFFTEIRNLEMLDHPNISRVLEVDDSGRFLAIEFIEGSNLEDYVTEFGPLGIEQWWTLAERLSTTINYCHSKGIIHKDISPRNIIMGPNGPVLVDFGISYLEKDHRLTSDGETIGTPPFMSPEHFGITAPKQMDVFCLGGTLIFAATGHYPFKGGKAAEWRESILFDFPDFGGLSDEQIGVLSPLLYKKPEHRGSLDSFSKLLNERTASNWESDLVAKELVKIRRESQNKLTQEKKQLSVKKLSLRKIISIASLVTILSIGIVSFGIVMIQDRSSVGFNENPRSLSQSSALTPDQLKKVSACKNLAAIEDYASAIIACKEPAEFGDAWGQYSLGFSLGDLGRDKEAEMWVLKAAKQNMPEALSWMAFDELEKGNYSKALSWAQQAADLGDLPGINALGVAHAYLEQYDQAVKWYKKAWELGDVLGAINLGYHYRFDSVNKVEAAKWLKIAAEADSVYAGETAFDYAEFLRSEGRSKPEFCLWYKKSADAKYKDDEYDGLAAYKKYCPDFNKAQTPTASPSSKKATPSPLNTQKPNSSSDSFKVSAPLASNVEVSEIFGRTFKDRLNYWIIPLTNSKGAKVPELTAIQFRLIGYPNAGWLEIPYKLKTDSNLGSVYAQVDDLLFAVMFNNEKYCPEFRVVREENERIVKIWNKGQPECATDF